MNTLNNNFHLLRTIKYFLFLMLTFLLSGVFLSNTVFGQTCNSNDPSTTGVEPVEENFPGGEPVCNGGYVSYRFGESGSGNTYTSPDGNIEIEVTSTVCGPVFSFTAINGVKVYQVFAKGGENQNVYTYPGGSTGDGNLHAPVNSSDKYAGLSHIDFCFAYALDISKTADTEFTRIYEWEIIKDVTPASWNLFCGDSGTSDYTVTVNNTGFTDDGWKVSGTITIENNTPYFATVTSVTDVISGYGSTVAVDCGGLNTFDLAPGTTKECTYSVGPIDSPDANPFGDLNTATVTTSTPIVEGGTATAPVSFGNPTTEVNKTVNVTDDKEGDLGTATAPDGQTFEYSRIFDCAGVDFGGGNSASYTFDNTAKIIETNQSDDASVLVNCYLLDVTKDAETTFKRSWDWDIMKNCGSSTEDNPLHVMPGQSYEVDYTVEVGANSTDSDFKVAGEITISNPNPTRVATLTSVSDLVSPDIAATVVCPSLTVLAGGSLTCTYSADLPDGSDRTNTATATLQNYDFASDGTTTVSGTKDFDSDAVSVTFGNTPAEEIDECVVVSDTYVGDLFGGVEVCAPGPHTADYSWTFTFSSPDDCGPQMRTNTAEFETNDTGTKGSDDCTVYFDVKCQEGCTLTQGYWKTHSEYGPAPYDDTWALLDDGADTPFFLSGQSYYEVLWTPPSGGNVYYILAHQYIAAQLNFLNGADPSDAQAAFEEATIFFETYTPDDATGLKGGKKRPITQLANILDSYNNGMIGPGHCDEDESSIRTADLGQLGSSLPQSNFIREQAVPSEYQIRPNPVIDQLELVIDANESGMRNINLYSTTGELIKVVECQVVKGQNIIKLNFDPVKFSAGVYFLNVTDDSSILWNGRFIKY